MEQFDVLIIGAGPSGTIAAATLEKRGLKCKIVERSKFPRFSIGESLLPRCMDHLERAGMLPAIERRGFQKKFGALFLRGDETCDFNFKDQYTPGWTWTWQVPRAEFDQALADEVASRGVPIAYETTVTAVEFDGGQSLTTVVDKAGTPSTIAARHLIDASGFGRVLPNLLGLAKPSDFPPREAHFVHIRDVNRPADERGFRIQVVIHRPEVWVWIIPFSNGVTSVGFVGNPEFFADQAVDPTTRLRAMIASAPEISARFQDVDYDFEPRTLKAYAASTTKMYGHGFVCTGNATEFLDPIFSSGVTFAMESGALAAELVAETLEGKAVDWQTRYVDHMNQGLDTFRAFVEAWYDGSLHDLFFHAEGNDTERRQICSVLAGYVWDQTNPFARHKGRLLKSLTKLARVREPRRAEAEL